MLHQTRKITEPEIDDLDALVCRQPDNLRCAAFLHDSSSLTRPLSESPQPPVGLES